MAIQTAAGIGMALIASEHFYSTMLSSPPTTEKFFSDTDEGKAKTRHMYLTATALSIVTAVLLSYILKEPWPLVATIVLCIIYIYIYERALRGEV